MVYKLPFMQVSLVMLMLFNGQLCGGWQSPEEKCDALERTGLHVNDAPAEYPGLPAEINSLPIRYMVDSALDQHALWQGRVRLDTGKDAWDAEKAQHITYGEGEFTYKQCTIGQILNTNPEHAPRVPGIRKRFFWDSVAYAFGTPFIFLSGAAILSAYHIKDVPLQKCAYITAALGGLWLTWGLYDSCFVDSNSKYGNAINAMNTRLMASDTFDPKKWLVDRSRETGIKDRLVEQPAASSSSSAEYEQLSNSLISNERNMEHAIKALPVRSYAAEAQQFHAEVKKQEDLAFMLGGGSAAALALFLAARAGK